MLDSINSTIQLVEIYYLNDLIAAAQEGNPLIKNFEMSIFDGKYPTSISSDYLTDLESTRRDDQKVAREKSN